MALTLAAMAVFPHPPRAPQARREALHRRTMVGSANLKPAVKGMGWDNAFPIVADLFAATCQTPVLTKRQQPRLRLLKFTIVNTCHCFTPPLASC